MATPGKMHRMGRWLANWTARTGPSGGRAIWIWPFTTTVCIGVILAVLSGQGGVYHGDLRGYSNPLGGPDWSMLWQAFVPRDAFYNGPDGTSLGTAFDLQVRPWPVVLLYEATGGGAITTATQAVLYGIAAIVLIAVACRLPIRPGARYAAATGLTILLASSPVLLFQVLQASEALSSTLCILALAAAVVIYCHQGTKDTAAWAALLASASLACIIRPQLLLIWVPVTAYLMIRFARSRPARRLGILAAAAAMAFAAPAIWTVAYGSAWGEGTSRQTTIALYTTKFGPGAQEVRSAARAALPPPPRCFPVTDEERSDVLPPCDRQEINTWSAMFARWYTRWVITNPDYSLRFLKAVLPEATTLTYTAPGVSIVPLPLQQLVTGARAFVPNSAGEPTKFDGPGSTTWFDAVWLVSAFVVVAAMAFRVRRRRLTSGVPLTLTALIIVTALAAIVAGLLPQPSTALEMARIAFPANISLRIATIIGVAVAIDALLLTASARKVRPMEAGT